MGVMSNSSSSTHTCANEVGLCLLQQTRLPLDAPLLDLGAGASSFIDVLLKEGYTNLIGVDTSAAALAAHAQRFTAAQNGHILWLIDNVSRPQQLSTLGTVHLWHDRTMLRVLRYPCSVKRMAQLTRPAESWVLLSVCLPNDATSIGDMSVQPYGATQLKEFLGTNYAVQQQCRYSEVFPNGGQQLCLYALFYR